MVLIIDEEMWQRKITANFRCTHHDDHPVWIPVKDTFE